MSNNASTSTKKPFTRERAVLLFAGFMSLLAVVLTQFVHVNFLWLSVLVGVNLTLFSITGFCPANIAFKALGFKSAPELIQEDLSKNT
jgi:hypothetical protein